MEEDLLLAKTIEARLVTLLSRQSDRKSLPADAGVAVQGAVQDLDLAQTVLDQQRRTIEPPRHPSSGAAQALQGLRDLGAALEGKINLHHTLGEGGMGVVHLATQATLGRHVAVKTLRPGASGLDAAVRILREAWVMGAIEHPNVVPVHDVAMDATGSPVIVMKRVEGRAWSELIGNPDEIAKRFSATDPLEWNLRTFASVCNAVHFAHSRGILHRDLKPDNVMIGEFGEVYVLDWGIAISLKDDPSGRLPPASQARDLAGTLAYMAPEMLLGDPNAFSARTDVYLLGGVLFEIFAGEPPHKGKDLQALVANILLSTPDFPENFPAEAKRICTKALSREPGQRYESAEALRVAIEEYLRHRGSRRLAWDARQSLRELTRILEQEPPGEEQKLAVANLLGECRFGYHAALSAWPGNTAARQDLDRALLLVIENALSESDAPTAETLLREVSARPLEVAARVEAAVKARASEDERLRRIEQDYDPSIGTRTRSFLAAIFGVLWTVTPLAGWVYARKVGQPSFVDTTVAPTVLWLALGLLAFRWARETLTKTALNRQLAGTFGVYMVVQSLLGVGGWLAGFPAARVHLLFVAAWALTHALLAIWVERWFALPAAVCAASFLLASAFPDLLYGLMALDNLVLTVVMVRVWFPRQDLARMHARRRALRQRAGHWLRGRG